MITGGLLCWGAALLWLVNLHSTPITPGERKFAYSVVWVGLVLLVAGLAAL